MRETLKLKISERRSKKDILRSYGLKADDKTPSAESAIVTQTMIDKITEEIKELRKTLKTAIQQKNEFFSLKVTTQKEIDLFISREKVLTEQIKGITIFITECESNIEVVETKIKEEVTIKKVVETQKKAFKASQKLVDAEESLNSAKTTSE
jgi:hypothetical protein